MFIRYVYIQICILSITHEARKRISYITELRGRKPMYPMGSVQAGDHILSLYSADHGNQAWIAAVRDYALYLDTVCKR
jgi:hypothetical protein